jgi:glutathione S-transferase
MRIKASAMLDDAFGMIDNKMADGRRYVHGDQYTLSDPYLLVFSRWLDRSNLGPVEKFGRVAAHRARMEDRPAVKKVFLAET